MLNTNQKQRLMKGFNMKDFIVFLLRSIVDDRENVKVIEANEGGNINLEIKVSEKDMGKVIGKKGKVIRSLRSLAKAKAIRDGVRVNLTLLETTETQ